MSEGKEKRNRYWIKTGFSYNTFGADEHRVVSLYYGTRGSLRWVDSWEYSTFLNSRLASSRAERRIGKLRERYDAKFL
jgi:hypothetical protein